MYETFGWIPESQKFNRRPLRLCRDVRNHRSALHVVSPTWPPYKPKLQPVYPVSTRYDAYFCQTAPSITLQFHSEDGSRHPYRIANAVCARRSRKLAGVEVQTFSVGTHLAFERFLLATGNYPEPLAERAGTVAEFAAFAGALCDTGQYPEEFPGGSLLVPFAEAARKAYELCSAQS